MTKKISQADFNIIIEKEMRSLARDYFDELWNELEEANLDASVIGEALIERILEKVASQQGEASASKIVSHIAELEQLGTLCGPRILQ